MEVFASLSGKLDEQLKRWSAIKQDDVPKVVALIKEADLPALVIKSPEKNEAQPPSPGAVEALAETGDMPGRGPLLLAGERRNGQGGLDGDVLAQCRLPALRALHPKPHVGVGLAAAIRDLLRDHQRGFRAEAEDPH